MQLPQWLARFNRHVTNPIQRLWAGWAPTMGILEHVGRRSGNAYRTPLNVFSTDEGVAVLLTYGPNRDWLKNLTAAGKGRMRGDLAAISCGHHTQRRRQARQEVRGGECPDVVRGGERVR
jgi:deazaflavin-dependent oxidoreductase (nitroreductase family)